MPVKLTKNEQKVYEKALLGFNAREIAVIYQRHPQRVQKVMCRIYKKFNVNCIQKLMALRICQLEDQLHSAGVEYD